MRSIGNDIVSLKHINKERTNSANFYSKFVTTSEQQLYADWLTAVLPFESFVWLLWSIKESVYKYLKRLEPELIFSPAKITVQHIEVPVSPLIVRLSGNDWVGTLQHNNAFYNGTASYGLVEVGFKSVIQTGLVATVVHHLLSPLHVGWGIRVISEGYHQSQSKAVREFLLDHFQTNYPSHVWHLEKNPVGYPILFQDNISTPIPVSFAHHQQLISYCFELPSEGSLL